ncbi:cyclin f-box [Fusarium bulbicola]|nr:cyclin f-box [Fusarium bulbicola]
MTDPRGSAPNPITVFEFDTNDFPRIIQTVVYSRFNAQYLPGAIHGPIEYPRAVVDTPHNSNNRPRPSGVLGRDTLLLRDPLIVRRIFPYCDLQSIFNLRQTNVRIRRIISGHILYRHILKALPLYHAILGTKYAQRVWALDFWNIFTKMPCAICGEFAMLISIPEWLRLCQKCVELGGRCGRGLDRSTKASRFVRLRHFAWEWLAPGRLIPGRFWHNDFGVGLKGWRRDIVEYSRVKHLDGGRPRIWKSLAPFNYLVMCAVPYMDPENFEMESGIGCKGCIKIPGSQTIKYEGMERVYSREEFLEHFQWCYRAQLLWQAYEEEDASIPINTTDYAVIQRAITSVEASQANG